MIGSVVAAFIVVLTLQHAFACTYPSQPKVINVELDDKDLVESRFQLDKRAVRVPFIGDYTIGKHQTDEQILDKVVEHSNVSNDVEVLLLNFTTEIGTINYVSVENLQNSQAVVCGTKDILGASSGTLIIRAPPTSDIKMHVIIGAHQ